MDKKPYTDKKPYNKKKRFYKRLFIVLAAVIVLIAGCFVFLAKNMRPVLTQKLKDQVVASSDSLYHITFNGLELNLYTGTITISDFHLIPDTAVYEKLKTFNKAPENIFDLSVQQLELRHAHPFRLFFKKEVQIKEIRINQPTVKIFHQNLLPNDTTQSLEVILRNLISGPLKSIRVDRIGLNNISVSYENNSDPEDKGFSLHNADLVLKDLVIDTVSIHDTTRFFYSKDMWVHLTDFKTSTKNNLYTLNLKDIAYSTQQQSSLIKGFSVKSDLSDAAFDKKVGIQTDKFDFEVDSVEVSGLNILHILTKLKIGDIQSVKLINGKLDVYRNRALPEKKTIKPLPQQLLRQAGTSFLMKSIAAVFTLDTLAIQNFDITYREHNPKSARTGEVSFNDLQGMIRHITNDSLQLLKQNHCVADLQTLFMNRGDVTVHFDFNLTDPAGAFSYSGHLKGLKATALNPATRNLGLVSIKSGNINQLDFNFNANNERALGSVHLLYQDLGIKILSVDESSGRLKNKGVASLFANLLVLKNNNIDDPNATKKTEVAYTRDKYKSMLNLMWKSMFEGIKKIVGMDKASDNKLQKTLKNSKLLEKIRGHKNDK